MALGLGCERSQTCCSALSILFLTLYDVRACACRPGSKRGPNPNSNPNPNYNPHPQLSLSLPSRPQTTPAAQEMTYGTREGASVSTKTSARCEDPRATRSRRSGGSRTSPSHAPRCAPCTCACADHVKENMSTCPHACGILRAHACLLCMHEHIHLCFLLEPQM